MLCAVFACSGKGEGNAAAKGLQAVDSLSTDSTSGIPAQDITMAFVGDVMMGTTWPDSLHGSHLPANEGKMLFDECKEIISGVDLACLNLEGSFLDGPGKRRPMRNPKTYFIFRMPTKYAQNLVDAGFDFAGNANNHINDFGAPGRTSTLSTLDNYGLLNAGLKGRNEIAVGKFGGHNVAITQFSHGANTLDINNLKELERVVGEMKKRGDIIVVIFHGGAEGTAYMHVPRKSEKYVGEARGNVYEFGHRAIDLGADIVVGHGPHVPRGIELYKGHLIAYSLGNFCTPYRMGIAGATGYAPLLTVRLNSDGTLKSGKIHSFIQARGKGPLADSNNSAAKLIKKLSKEDFPESRLDFSDDGGFMPAK